MAADSFLCARCGFAFYSVSDLCMSRNMFGDGQLRYIQRGAQNLEALVLETYVQSTMCWHCVSLYNALCILGILAPMHCDARVVSSTTAVVEHPHESIMCPAYISWTRQRR